ncbi:phosphopyruvate hydratase [candidate division WWE3 bacterium]|uniref:Enolase n=1 Tax=candidate division WWE3 bacterium TaxID=2053526 RepID=A0A955RS21_UNCKA|nr:phosphopyruvate hydratase [candidate division WWE3 bacterium]
MVLIDYIEARQILNSRGEPTIETTVHLTSGETVSASAPNGASRSSHEAIELVDKDFSVYFGKSVNHAVSNINETIAPRLKKLDPLEQHRIDQILIELDGTPNKAHLGGNATLSVSMAVAKAAAVIQQKPLYEHINHLLVQTQASNKYEEDIRLSDQQTKPKLPIPGFTMFDGGKIADSTIPIEEYLIFPVSIPKMSEKVRAAAEINNVLREVLHEKDKIANIGDTGGYASSFDDVFEPLDLIVEAVKRTNYNVHNQILYGFDIASTHMSSKLPDDFIDKALTRYPIVCIIDPFDEEDWDNFNILNNAYPNIFVAGDDLTATSLERLYKAIDTDAIDSVVVKPNQIGTVTETLQFVKVAKDAGIELVISDRSGETTDTFVVDLAVAVGAQFMKTGNVMRGERVIKYNHLMKIAEKFEG